MVVHKRLASCQSESSPTDEVTDTLSPREQTILEYQLSGLPAHTIRHGTIFTYAKPLEMAILIMSIVLTILAGGLVPWMTVIYSQFVGSFQHFAQNKISELELIDRVARLSLYFVYLGMAEFALVFAFTVGFYFAGERITRNFRAAYLKSIIRQNMAFFDQLGAGEVTARITADINLTQEGITNKLSITLTAAATAGVSIAIALNTYWRFALVLLAGIAVIALAEAFGGRFAVRYSIKAMNFHHSGATVVEEAISSIRHIVASGLQDTMVHRYAAHLKRAQSAGLRSRLSIALMISIMNSAPYFIYGLAFSQGIRFIMRGTLTTAGLVQITMATVTAAFAAGRVAPAVESFIASIASSRALHHTIARQSPCDPLSLEGSTPTTIEGTLSLNNVSLVYPSRPDVTVLKNISCVFPAFSTTAVVGKSGCGKSSIVGLLQRFYNPTRGEVSLDGQNIQALNLQFLRRQFSVVNQEPVLFNTTIFANIQYGMQVDVMSDEDIEDRVIKAAKKAHAHGFIMALPMGYQTVVGSKGTQLSGGQRQRISLARAFIREPKILLLDEATSALDAISERAVQAELDETCRARTTVVIAHRLSTVQNADNILVMSQGSIVEQGKHDELLALNGVYARLVENQQFSDDSSFSDNLIHSSGQPEIGDVSDRNSTQSDTRLDLPAELDELQPLLPNRRDARNAKTEVEASYKRLLAFRTYFQVLHRFNKPELFLIVVGTITSALSGLVWPMNSIIFGRAISALSITQPMTWMVDQSSNWATGPTQNLTDLVDFWATALAGLGFIAWVLSIIQGLCFAVSSEKLVSRAKQRIFRTLLNQDIEYFDQASHSAGALSSLVTSTVNDLAGLSGPVIGSILMFTATIAAGIIISLISGWKLALVCLPTVPIVAICGWLRLQALVVFDNKMRKANQEAAIYASEMVSAVRTVASLSLEHHVVDEYHQILQHEATKSLRTIIQASVLYAFAQSFTFLTAALVFWYGGNLIAQHEYNTAQVIICFTALVSGSQIAGAVFSFAPDMSKAIHAGRDLQVLSDRRPLIDTMYPCETSPPLGEGRIDFVSVSFAYPNRPANMVLKNFNLTLQAGQYIALVGPSGCGKSTVLSLVERFFDPTHGRILLDNQDISSLNVNGYRQLISLVSQEPVLYQGTIHENLKLGAPEEICEEDIIQACKEANIYDFITSLPSGFATDIGANGTMLSGGQKQRLAIARALLRDAKILLLDEATSALDSESEKLVQDALDRVAKRRTTIAIAHRLSTIQHADLICVLDNGQLVESGTHTELMAKRRMYYDLVSLQNQDISSKAPSDSLDLDVSTE